MTTYAYLRVSSKSQSLDRQTIAINKYCLENNITNVSFIADKASGADLNRKGYRELRDKIKTGDTLIIKELDRLSRDKTDLKNELNYFKDIGVKVKILNIPTTLQDFTGVEWVSDLINNILIEVLTSVAEEERMKIRKRQMEGIEALKARNGGKGIGRPKRTLDKTFVKYYNKWVNKEITAVEFAKLMQVSRCNIYNCIKQYQQEIKEAN